jgi:hypothetical protein
VPFTPYDAATHAIARSRALLRAAQTQTRPGQAVLRADLRRLSVVMAVAALDAYMHRLIVERAFWHDDLPPALAKLDVPFQRLLAQADEAGEAARSAPWNSRPRVAIKRQLRDRLLRETFQRYEEVSKALAMAGRSGNWDAIGQRMSPRQPPNDIRIRLNSIVTRRNQIVHEGDYERLERPRGPRRNSMSHSAARGDVDFLADLIDAIHAVV